MFKLSEIAPAIQAELDAHNEAMAKHREVCREEFCEQCGRHRPRKVFTDDDNPFLTSDRQTAIGNIPRAFADAKLGAEWLIALVGAETVQRAMVSLAMKRLAFIGPPGAGKTSLAAAMYRASIEASKRPRFHRWTSSHALAKARAITSLGGEAPEVDKALHAELLLIDELGGEDARHASAVAEVLYERHAENRATWITTGVSPKVIADRYGGGIARRVFEGTEVFRLGGKR